MEGQAVHINQREATDVPHDPLVFGLAEEWVAMKDVKMLEHVKNTELFLDDICKQLDINKEQEIK